MTVTMINLEIIYLPLFYFAGCSFLVSLLNSYNSTLLRISVKKIFASYIVKEFNKSATF